MDNNEILKDTKIVEKFLLDTFKEYKRNLKEDGNKSEKIRLFSDIRKLVNTLYFHPSYHEDFFLEIGNE